MIVLDCLHDIFLFLQTMFLVPRPAYIVGGPVVSFETVGVAPKEGTGVGLMVT